MRKLLTFIMCAPLFSAPATGQDVGAMQMQNRRMASQEPLGDPVETHAYAICVAKGRGGDGILEELPNSTSESDLVFWTSRYGENTCDPRNRRLLVASRFMRGGAAEYLLERPDGRLNQEIFAMPNNEELARLDPDTRSAIVLIQIGECAAKANPSGVTALLGTEVKSREEAAAFQVVVSAVGGCVPAGLDFRIPPLLLRAYLAEGAYRNAVVDRAVQEAAE